ncbi:MAG: hypothetical protein IT447_05505 [Phycisphaerales bacterium]|nr:hypothetical protein [Phycisphaerales bacterium]
MDGGDIAYSWPSRVLESYYDRLGDREDPRNVMVGLHRKGIDYLPLLIQNARSMNLKFYGSFRMNDCHHRSDPWGILSSKFWQEHQEYRLWDVTDARTYYNASLDYSFPEVRRRRLDAIRETLQWYDFDGIELDFCRNPYIFPPTEAWARRQILTDLIRQIRQDMTDAGKKWGRTLDLLIRVPFSNSLRRNGGIDVDQWIDERLMDMLTMSCLSNDYNQIIEPWLTRCKQANIAFYPSVEAGPAHNAAHNHVTRLGPDEIIQQLRAAAQNFLGQGASGVYLYNFPCHLTETRRTPEERHRITNTLCEIGSEKTLSHRPKQYTFWRELPMQLESHRPAKHHQTLRFCLFDGDLWHPDTQVRISLRQAVEPNPHVDTPPIDRLVDTLPPGWVTYWLNGRPVQEEWIKRTPQPGGRIDSGFTLGDHETIILTPPASMMRVGENTLGFYIPRFPEEHDPYANVYELLVNILISSADGSISSRPT